MVEDDPGLHLLCYRGRCGDLRAGWGGGGDRHMARCGIRSLGTPPPDCCPCITSPDPDTQHPISGRMGRRPTRHTLSGVNYQGV